MSPTDSIFGDGHHQPSIDAENADELQVLSDDDDSELFILEPGSHNTDINMLNNQEHQPEHSGDSISVRADTDANSDVEFLSAIARTRRFASSSSVGDCNQIQIKLESDNNKQDEGNDLELLGEQPIIKEEPQEEAFQWVDIGDELIELSDSDEDNANTRTLPTTGRSILRWSNVGHRRTSDNPDQFKAMARLFANRALKGRRHIGGAGRIFTAPQANVNKHRGQNATDDGDTWMYSIQQDDDDSSSNFAKIKRLYKAKKKAKKNNLVDDIAFKKAIAAEKTRLKRLEAKLRQSQLRIDSDDDEAEESDDGIFMPALKRLNPETTGTGDQEGAVANEISAPKRRKVQKSSSKRTRAELQKEEWANLMAGWEERAWLVLEEDTDKDTHGRGGVGNAKKKTSRKAKGKSTKKITKARHKDKGSNAKYTDDLLSGNAPGGPRRKNSSRMMANLGINNIFDAAKSNLGKAAVPVLTGTRKDHAMANLIATVPLDESKKRQAITDKNKVLKATTTLGYCSVYRKGDHIGDGTEEIAANPLQDGGNWILKGMASALYHHQVLGAATMKERELGATEPFGGILADSMGFGKTVMVIAVIIANPPGSGESHRSTLIICSPALIEQWDNEINKHSDNSVFGQVIKHFGLNKLSKKGASGRRCIPNIENADIVLSTYFEVVKSYPKCHIPEEITDKDDQFQWWQKEWDGRRDLLHRAHFYRVVLDEAHAMKNHRSYTSIACRALMAKHKWALSGTPIHNSIEELYPYFKFLRIPCTNSFGVFRQNFCKAGSNVYNQRLHSVLDDVMIRRTHVDELFGSPINPLPEAHEETLALEFNKVERVIYEIFKHRFRRAIERAKQQGELEKHARLILIMFQRLRQLTSHLLMLQGSMEKLFEVEDIELLWKSTESEVMTGNGNANDMKKALQEMIAHKHDISDSHQSSAHVESNTAQGVALDTEQEHEGPLNFKFRKFVRMLKKGKEWGNLRARSICSKCGDPADDPWVTSCMHLYCGECLRAMSNESASNGQEHTACLQCGEVFTGSEPCRALKELEADEIQSTRQKAADAGQKPDDRKRGHPHRIAKDNIKWCELGDQVLPSTKTAAVQVKVEEWLRDFPQIKIIVFSQFHLSMLVMGQLFKAKGWKYCTYHGQMSHIARSEAVEKFGKDPELRIMIASLKCGGIGLNLTMATRVICIDLWFNSAIEQQAFCRVFRIGQTQETYLTRFVIKNTVDEKLVEMQKHKDKVIGAAMDDKTVLASLTVEELIGLFGDECSDGKVKPFIYAEEHPELAHLMPDPNDGEDDPMAWQP